MCLGELLELDQQVVLALRDAWKSRQRWAVIDAPARAPPSQVDAVVLLVASSERAADFGSTTEALTMGSRVQALHSTMGGVEPSSGRAYRVDDPDLLKKLSFPLVSESQLQDSLDRLDQVVTGG